MAIGRIRVALIIILFAGSTAVPVLMETSIVPMINLLNFVQDFVEVQNDELVVHYDKLLNSIKRIECLTDESSENQTVIQITINVSNNDPYWFDLLIPGLDMTVYWKAGLPYELEKQTVLGWVESDVNDPNWKKEPNYYQDGNGRRWTRVLGIKIDPLRIKPQKEKDLQIKIYLYNDEWDRGKSNALGQMIGTILRTKSTKDPYTNETLMHISGTASLDIPLSFPLSLDVGLDLSSFLNLTELLGGLGQTSGVGAGNGEEEPNLFDLLFDVPLSIFDIQNYNDSNGNFKRDFSGIDNETNMKIWTEDLYQHGAISAYVFMDLKDQLGMKSLNVTMLQSSYNPDDADVNKTWHPEIAGSPIPKETITNQLFLYIPESTSLHNPDWGNKIFGLLGFTSDQRLIDYPTQVGDFGDGNIIAGGTLRLTGDLRENASFSVGDGLGALITQAVEGILPIGIFGSIDLKLNDMPLSICLDLPLEVNLTSLLNDLMGGEEEEGGGGDIFSMLMDYMGLKTILLNGIAFDTWESILQLNFSTDLDMFLPYGIYMPTEVTYDENGDAVPYLGIAGGPIQIFDAAIPDDLNGQRFAVEFTDTPTIINGTALQLSRGNVTEIIHIFNGSSIYNSTHEWWNDAHPTKYFSTNPVSTTIYVDTSATGDPFTQANFTSIKVIYKSAVWKTDWYNEHLIMNISSLDSPTLKESLAKLMATIGKTDQGEGIAYTFDDDGNPLTHHGDLQKFLRDNGELPNADDHKSSFQLTEDQFKLDLTDIVPDFWERFDKCHRWIRN